MKYIYTIGTDGSVQIEVEGAQGPACSLKTKKVEDALGVVKSDELKPEFYQKEVKKVHNTN